MVADGKAMWAALARGNIDLIVLDLMLPGDDGLSLCRKLRAESDTPVIMLTARGEETDASSAWRWARTTTSRNRSARGSCSPASRAFCVAIAACRGTCAPTRRAKSRSPAGASTPSRGTWCRPHGVVTSLSGNEYQLLRIFLSHPNHVLTRDQLMLLSKGHEADPMDRSIDIQVSRLRQRLGDDPAEPKIIKTVRGEGYVLAVPVEVLR